MNITSYINNFWFEPRQLGWQIVVIDKQFDVNLTACTGQLKYKKYGIQYW